MSTTTIVRRGGRTAAAVLASALGLSALAASPAHAGSAVFTTGADTGATATISDYVFTGSAIHIDGTGWTKSTGVGSCIFVKLGSGSGSTGTALATKQTTSAEGTGACAGQSPSSVDAWAAVPAAADGTLSADIPFPTSTNSNPAVTDSDWAAGTTHHLRVLTGLDGSPARSAYLDFTVAAPATTPTINQPTVTVSGTSVYASLTGSGFPGGEKLTADLGSTALTFTSGSGSSAVTASSYTVPASGTFSSVRLNLPSGTRAGTYAPVIHRSTSGAADYPLSLTVNPTVAWSAGVKPGATGTLTLSNLPNGATVSSVKLGDATVASGLTANDSGVATATYTIASTTTPGQATLTIAQDAPAAIAYSVTTTVYPDETISGTGRFTVASDANDPALYQGLYQSAYSETEDALFATAASGTGTSEDGYLYKLDPDTLALIKSVHPKDVTDVDGVAGRPVYGIGVDDVNGTVWVTNTRTTGVAVYRASDLTLLKQYPASTITHPRDAVYDPKTNVVFVSSASEGASGNGYISVFEGGDNDGDGTPYEKIKDVQTGPRSTFNPVSLSLDNGTLVSPSLSTNKVAVIDTATAATSAAAASGELDASVKLIEIGAHSTAGNGRGASGIAYDDEDHRIFVASQNDNAVFVADSITGELLKTVPTGQQALNVAYDSVHKLAYVTNFGGTSVTVLDTDGTKVAALPITRANHVTVTKEGVAYVVDKNSANSAKNRAWKITPRIETINGTDVLYPTAAGATGAVATTPLSVSVAYGETIHVSGTNFRVQDATSGSTLAVKLDGGAAEPKSGKATNPSKDNAAVNGVYAVAAADTEGTWSLDLPFPSADNVNDASLAWGVGDTHYLRLLSGSLKTGDTVRSIVVKVTVTPLALTTGTPTIGGTAKVGQTLTADPGTWSEGTAFAYQWQRDGVDIAGATSPTYTAVADDATKSLQVAVTGTLENHGTETVVSAPVTVAAADVVVTPTPSTPALTPAEQKVVKAAAVVTKDNATIKALKAQIKKAKGAKKAKLKKKLTKAKAKLKKDKKALAKAKAALAKSKK
ncbi:MAG: hypothetical protein QM572_17205 [Nocardioides sp.]|uniref:hypothetical protein n=1 Tax=Nocardioides sp. TaxID=35761 RepID=UPI0039E6A808